MFLCCFFCFFFFNDTATTEIYTLSLHDALPIYWTGTVPLGATGAGGEGGTGEDRKSTRLNSSHTVISYAVFCLKKKKKKQTQVNLKKQKKKKKTHSKTKKNNIYDCLFFTLSIKTFRVNFQFLYFFFFFNDTATTEIYTLSLHDALPIFDGPRRPAGDRVERGPAEPRPDRKSTRLNSSHTVISYAVFCLKKKKITKIRSSIINTCTYRPQSLISFTIFFESSCFRPFFTIISCLVFLPLGKVSFFF